MDSLNKYQELIKNAKTSNEKIQLAMKLQKILYGKSSFDTTFVKNIPKSKEAALIQKEKQIAEIKKQKQEINSSRSRDDKYKVIEKFNARNDSIRLVNKDAGKHGIIQQGLFTLPNASQFFVDPRAPVDTSLVQVRYNFHKSANNSNGPSTESFSISSAVATMYKQNGAIVIVATNDVLPQWVYQNNIRKAVMVRHHDLSGSASSQGSGAPGVSNDSFSFAFAYNPASNQYAIGAGAGLIATSHDDHGHEKKDTGGISSSAHNDPSTWKMAGKDELIKGDNPVADFVKSPTGFSATYNHHVSTESGTEEESFTAEIKLAPPRFEAFIEPADTTIYRKWLPEGPELTNYPILPNEGKGNDLQLKVTLWNKQTNKEAIDNFKTVIKLNTSHMPGYCMNFPEDDKEANDKPDMRFDNADSAIYETWSSTKLTTRKAPGPQYVTVVSYDYGGIADVTADVTTPEGFTIKAHLRKSPIDTFTLPKRTSGSMIADYWKQLENANGKDDTADDERLMQGDKYPGDGLTLYEEYRGFLEDRKHFRGDAQKKDLMVCNKIATQRSQDGIDMCEATLNQYGNKVYMHSKFKEDEFGRKKDPDAEEQMKIDSNGVRTPIKYDRCINYNAIKAFHLVDQHGIALMFGDTALGYAQAVLKNGKGIGPPKNYYFLVITKDFSPGDSAWAEIRGTLDSNGHIHVGAGTAKILTDEYGVTVAHEMLHCFHMKHHGSQNDWGHCGFKLNAQTNQWFWTTQNDWPLKNKFGFQIPDYPIKLYFEDKPDAEISGADVAVAESRSWEISGEKSTHSGVEDCIMRYDIAHGFMKNNWEKVYLLRSKVHSQELTGINICNDTKGTGVNSAERKPISRYGDAEPGHGNCIHQFCVSDIYD